MKKENIKALENLSLVSHLFGLFSIFIGVIVIFMDVLNGDFRHIQIGIFIFAVGYALAKIASKLSDIVISEQDVGGTKPSPQAE